MKLSDAIVAACAIIKNLPLSTADKSFSKIDELKSESIVPIKT